MFQRLFGASGRTGLFLGSPEAEAEASASRMPLVDVYEDFHGLAEQLAGEKFVIVGRKGCGKSAFGVYTCELAKKDATFSARFIRRSDVNLERIVQIGAEAGVSIQAAAFFEWVIYTTLLKLALEHEALYPDAEYNLLRTFLSRNSGYIQINELELIEQVGKTGFDVSIEALKRFLGRGGYKQEVQIKSERAAFYKVLPSLAEILTRMLRTASESGFDCSYALFFDDLDIGFSANDESSRENLVDLLRVCKRLNNDVFQEGKLAAKAIVLIRDDIVENLQSGFADTAKLFATYSAPINWLQAGVPESDLYLKQFINKRIHSALSAAGTPANTKDPWDSLVGVPGSFKTVVDVTLFRPRDLLLFFKPLETGAFKLPLDRPALTNLINQYAAELAAEMKNELSSFYTTIQVENIFSVLGQVRDLHTPFRDLQNSFMSRAGTDGKKIINRLVDGGVLGAVDAAGRFYFRTRGPVGALNDSSKLVVCNGLRPYLRRVYGAS